ncbi:hypothetical protein PCE1_004515 [Barthelona sp. PCE]
MSDFNFSLSTFSSSGRLTQVDHAFKAAENSSSCVGLTCHEGVVVGAEKVLSTPLIDASTITRLGKISDNCIAIFSGIVADFRGLLKNTRKKAAEYFYRYNDLMPIERVASHMAGVMQEYTQKGGVRPFGVCVFIVGFDETGSRMYQIDPSGSYYSWKAAGIGKGRENVTSFLEKRYTDTLGLEECITLTIECLKEVHNGLITKDNIELAVVKSDGVVSILTPEEIQDYLEEAE